MTARRVLTTEATVAATWSFQPQLWHRLVTHGGSTRLTITMITARIIYFHAAFLKLESDLNTHFIWTKKLTTWAMASAIRNVRNPPKPLDLGEL